MHRRQRFALFLAEILGLSIAIGACGGMVVVDGEASGSATSSSSSSGLACSPTVEPGDMLVYACVKGGPPCADKSAQSVFDELSAELAVTNCDMTGGACCTDTFLKSVACGPDPSVTTQCCYQAIVTTQTVCEGRPLTSTSGVALVADLRRGQTASLDWASSATPDCTALDMATREILSRAWARDGLAEHASVASFARFVLELLAVGAPSGLVADAQRAMADELRHTTTCFGLASAYADAPISPGRLDAASAPPRASLADIAAATVREGCIGETIAALFAAEARDSAVDPAVIASLDAIAFDEADHAALAWRAVAFFLEIGDDEVKRAVEDAFNATPEVSSDIESGPSLRRHGILSTEERQSIARKAMTEIIAPCSRALLHAPRAHTSASLPAERSNRLPKIALAIG
jgi:hypothetical protein